MARRHRVTRRTISGKRSASAPRGTSRKRRAAGRRGVLTGKAAAAARRTSRAAPKRTAPRATAKSGGKGLSQTAVSSRRARRTAAPDLDRWRIVDKTIPTPPSSLNLDRHASAVRSGRAEILEHIHEHTAASPALTAGDVDADWQRAYDSGDEAPGGDNPTPDQDVVEDIGKALGIQYDDAEELKGSDKVAKRDQHRWELDPASSEDYPDRRKR